MKKNSSNNHSPDENDPDKEKWVPKKEIMKKYKVRDRTLTYWRGRGKIRYINVKNRTYYIEDEVRVMVEKQNRPKKYFGIRKTYLIRKLKNIDPVLAAVVLGLAFAFANGLDFSNRVWWIFLLKNGVFSFTLLVGIIYGTVKLIIFTWNRFFNVDKPKE